MSETPTTFERDADRRRTMSPLLHQLTQSRRRLLGSAALTMLAARLGTTDSARAMTTK